MIDNTNYTKSKEWCGPSALCLLTGCTLVQATQLLTRISGHSYQEFQAVWDEEMIIALNEMGYTAKDLNVRARYPDHTYGPTLKRFMHERQPFEVANPMLISIHGHLLAAHWGLMGDNWTGKMVPVTAFPMTGRNVQKAYTITPSR